MDKMATQKRPCKACTDFKQWSITQKALEKKKDCPADREELGRATWTFLHSMAAYYPDQPTVTQQKEMSVFMHTLSKFYPCDDCAEHMRKCLKEQPPKTESQPSFAFWMCQLHNKVNEELGKPQFDCNKINQRWRDGTCD